VPRIHRHNLSLQPAWRDNSDNISIKESWIDVTGYYRNNVDTSLHSIPQGKHANMEKLDAFGPHHDFYTSLPRPQASGPYGRRFTNDSEPVTHSSNHHNNSNSNNNYYNSNSNNSNGSNTTGSEWWTVDRHIITTPCIDIDGLSDDQHSTLYSNLFPEI
jgi:hypothetical protein